MAENTPITIYTADCIGNAANCLYPNEVKITDDFSAKLAFATDMVCARYKNNYRNTANFEVANALPGDCDNDHSEIAADWVTPEDIADLFADIPYVLHYSCHHIIARDPGIAACRSHQGRLYAIGHKANPPDVFIHFVALLQRDTVANFGGNKL